MVAPVLKIKSSTVEGKVPASLSAAELAINLKDQKLYSSDADGTVFQIGASGGATPGTSAPSDPQPGDLWLNTNTNTLNYYDGSQWVELGQAGASGVISVNGETGTVVLTTADLANDSGYITAADIPVDSVNGKTGVVVLTATDVGAATTAQGEAADTALQPGDDITELNNNAGFITAAEVPADAVTSVNSKVGEVVLNAADVGALAPGANNSELTNDSGFITDAGVTKIVAGSNVTISPTDGTGEVTINSSGGGGGGGDVSSVNGQTGAVVLSASDVGAATTSQGSKADSAVQSVNGKTGTSVTLNAGDVGALKSGDNISELNNNSGYITSAQVNYPVTQVNGKQGAVTLVASDVGALAPGDDISTLNNNTGYITSASIPNATESQAGVASIANSIEMATGTDNSKIVSPKQYRDYLTANYVRKGEDVSEFDNDAGYITGIPDPLTVSRINIGNINGTTFPSESDLSNAPDTGGLIYDKATNAFAVEAQGDQWLADKADQGTKYIDAGCTWIQTGPTEDRNDPETYGGLVWESANTYTGLSSYDFACSFIYESGPNEAVDYNFYAMLVDVNTNYVQAAVRIIIYRGSGTGGAPEAKDYQFSDQVQVNGYAGKSGGLRNITVKCQCRWMKGGASGPANMKYFEAWNKAWL